ncbi:MAG TPA: hypothetical protein VFK02_21440 [Kofleriaceae bacterium]|nr:hypothetical protein [Kofleriaceae bacterium]
MRAIVFVLLSVVALEGIAPAQPGQAPGPPAPAPQPYPPPGPPQPYPPPGPGQPYPPPPGGVVAPYQYAPVRLTPEEQELLTDGEISDGRHLAGVLGSFMVGWGIGQAIQGRYGDTGWIFTVGEAGSVVALITGFVREIGSEGDDSTGGALLVGGLVGILVFRTWEVIDSIVGPPRHNTKVRELRMRLGLPQPTYVQRIRPYVAPTLSHDAGGATAGLTLRF